MVDATTGAACALPTRLLAGALDKAPIKWRRIAPMDSTTARPGAAHAPGSKP